MTLLHPRKRRRTRRTQAPRATHAPPECHGADAVCSGGRTLAPARSHRRPDCGKRLGGPPAGGSGKRLTPSERGARASFRWPVPSRISAPRPARRALLTPRVNPGPRYRCGRSTFKSSLWATAGGKRGPHIRRKKRFSQARRPSPAWTAPKTPTFSWPVLRLVPVGTLLYGENGY